MLQQPMMEKLHALKLHGMTRSHWSSRNKMRRRGS